MMMVKKQTIIDGRVMCAIGLKESNLIISGGVVSWKTKIIIKST